MKHLITSIALTIIAFLLIGCAGREDAIASSTTTNATNNVSDAVEPKQTATAEPTPTLVPPTNTPTQIPTSTPNPTFTPLPTATPTRLPTLTLTPTAVPPTATPAPTETPQPTATVEIAMSDEPHAVIGVTLDDVLNVRAEPDPSAEIVGTLNPTAQDITVASDRRAVGNAEWVQITSNGVMGWVNAAYLARQVGQIDVAIANRALSALIALRDKDMAAFAALAHPVEGVAFAPLTNLEPGNLQFSAEKIPTLFNDPTVYEWGYTAGEGAPIRQTFAEYYFEYIYPHDYLFADTVGYNTNIITGNMIDNSRDLNPAAQIVEYHFDGFYPDYGGLDYRTLRLVLKEFEGEWYVNAVVNNEWTP